MATSIRHLRRLQEVVEADDEATRQCNEPAHMGGRMNGSNAPHGQEVAALIATAVAARLEGNQPLKHEALRCLDHEFKIKLMFADELANQEVDHA